MNSRPLQIAFTALTLSLIVSMSLWIVHASHQQIDLSKGVTLQMPSVPAQIDRPQFQKNIQPDPFAEPFTNNGSESVGGELAPRGVETATVSKQTVNPAIIDVQEQLLEEEEQKGPIDAAEETLELPAIDLSQGSAAEFPPAEEQIDRPAPPPATLDSKPLDAPEPPAWLSVQATLEEEIEELRKQQHALNESLKVETQEAELFHSRNAQLSQEIKTSQAEIKRLQVSLQRLDSETTSLKSTVAEKADQIDELKSKLKETQKLTAQPKAKAIIEVDPSLLEDPKPTASAPKSLPLPPMPDQSVTENSKSAIDREPKSLYDNTKPTFEEAPLQTAELPTDEIVPSLTGKTAPPLPDQVSTNEPAQRSTKPIIEADPQLVEESPYYEPEISQPAEPVTEKKRGLIYDMKDWFHNFRTGDDSCSDCEPICTDGEICTKTACAVPNRITESTCECPRCTSANRWIHEDEMLSHQSSQVEHQNAGLLPQMKRWWTHRKHERNVRYEPAIVGRPANATILPAAHAE